MQSIQSPYKQLFKLHTSLGLAQEDILQKWMSSSTIKEIFATHKISLQKFSLLFAPKFLEYILDVIVGDRELEDSSIVSKFVSYMLTKDIAPHEVYDIFTRLRKEFTLYIFSTQEFSVEQSSALLKEISLIFDRSFSTTLLLFRDMLKDRNTHIERPKEYIKQFNFLSQSVEVLDLKLFVVQNSNVILANNRFFETLGVKNLEDFHIKFRRGLSFLNNISFKKDLFVSENYSSWIEAAALTKERISVTLFDSLSRKESTHVLWINILIKSEPKKYLVSLKSEQELYQYRDKNYTSNRDELTNLYSYAYFKSHISKISDLHDSDKYALVVVDIRNLREINESFDYEKGDRLIISIAQKIQSLSRKYFLVFRLSGSKIGVLLKSITAQKAYDWAVHLRCELEEISKDIRLSLCSYAKHMRSMQVELKALKLLESSESFGENHVLTDIAEIDKYDLLDNQEMFVKRLEKLNSLMDGVLLYKEIIVKSKIKILKSTKNTLFVSLSPKQFSIAKIGENFYIDSKELGDIRSVIKSISYANSSIEIFRFYFDEHTPLKRKLLRVTTDESLEIELIDDNISMDAEVHYLNEQHVSFRLKRKKALKIGKLTLLEVNIDGKYFEIEGVVYMLKKDRDGYICVIELQHTSHSNTLFRKYIAKRQLQIIKELNALLV